MKLPALRNSTALSEGQSVEDLIRNSTKALQRMAAAIPSSGMAGVTYLTFNGNTGVYRLNKEPVDPKSLGRILVPHQGFFEGCVEWAGGSPLQKIHRPLFGNYDEPMDERLLTKPLSHGAYRKDTDGPSVVFGFLGYFLDDGASVWFEHNSLGAKKAVNALATTATQAIVAFGELVHPVIDLGSSSYDNNYGTKFDPVFNSIGFVTDVRVKEVDVINDADILTRPTASKARLARKATETPAI
jgi:hypothetical protein